MDIRRDTEGIAHISGCDQREVFYGLGYAHGRDRALQLLLMRILGQGRACELLSADDEMLEIDMFFRRMNWAGRTGKEIQKIPPEAMAVCDAYCSGVNKAIGERKPWECRLLGYRPEPWRIEDILLLSRMLGYLTLSQSQGEMERLLVEMVQAGISEEKLHELFPGILQELDVGLIKKIKLQERIVSPPSLWNTGAPQFMASNNWVVSGERTASGKPILANDPHLEVNRLPNIWYEAVLKTPDRYLMGASIPGLPAVLIGRNPDLAWGATYTFMDATDAWIEYCKDGRYYREPGEWQAFHQRRETIFRKKKTSVEVVFYENEHGVLEGNPYNPGYYLATRWAPADGGAIGLTHILRLWSAETVEEAMSLLGPVESSWSFVLADGAGNIGYQMSGWMPRRREGISGFVPLPGWDRRNDWQGFVDHTDLPRCINPESGIIVTANQNLNELGNADPINIVMGPYRADRIRELLETGGKLTCEDMYKIQYDVYSPQARQFMEILYDCLPDTPAAEILKNWKYNYSADSEGAWLFEAFYQALYREIFGNNGLGKDALGHLETHTGIFTDFYLNFDRIMMSEASSWFNGRTRGTIYARAAERALSGEPLPWGKSRQVMMRHILFGGRLPRFLGFDRGPLTLIGSRATPHQGQIYESAGRQTTFAPSYRMATDLSTDRIHTNMCGGPSDRRFSRWYVSDLENWKNGRYKQLSPEDTEKHHPFK